jgi:hypothetical protein
MPGYHRHRTIVAMQKDADAGANSRSDELQSAFDLRRSLKRRLRRMAFVYEQIAAPDDVKHRTLTLTSTLTLSRFVTVTLKVVLSLYTVQGFKPRTATRLHEKGCRIQIYFQKNTAFH